MKPSFFQAIVVGLILCLCGVQAQSGGPVARSRQGAPGGGNATARPNIHPMPWTIKQPERAEHAAIDPSDTRTCLNELAGLASFHMRILPRATVEAEQTNSYLRPSGIKTGFGLTKLGASTDAAVTAKMLEYTVLWNQLGRANDSGIRQLSQESRDAITDIWRVYRAAQDFGFKRQSREAGYKASWSMGSHAAMWALQEMVDPRTGSELVYKSDGNGGVHAVGARSVTLRDGPNQAQEQEVNSFYEDQARIRSDAAQLQEYGEFIYTCILSAYLDLGQMWEKGLFPRLEKICTNQPASTLLASYTKAWYHDENNERKAATLGLRNVSGRTLTDMALHVRYESEFGDIANWYGFLHEFADGNVLFTDPTTTQAAMFDNLPGKVKITVKVLCADGSNQRFTFQKDNGKNFGADSVYHTQEQLLKYYEIVIAPFNHAAGTNLATPKDKAEADEIKKLRSLLQTVFSAPADPVSARSLLLAVVQTNRICKYSGTNNEVRFNGVLTLGPLDETTGLMSALLMATNSLGVRSSLQLVGRLREECERGCVLGFVPAASVDMASFANHLTWLLTSPEEINNAILDRHSRSGGFMGTFFGIKPYDREADNTVTATFAIYLDGYGKLCLQSSPGNGGPMRFHRLTSATAGG